VYPVSVTRKPSRVCVLALLLWHLVAGFAAPLAHAASAAPVAAAAAASADHCALHAHSRDALSDSGTHSGSTNAPTRGKHNCCADDTCQCAAPTDAPSAATVTISFAKAPAISVAVRVALVATRADLFFRPPIA
jgi:hypothetical protein